jgi:UDP-glucose 4-epimerase
VTVVDNLAGGDIRPRAEKAGYDYFDISDAKNAGTLEWLCKGVTYVFHLAALPRVQASYERPVATAMANVIGTVMMLDAARKAGVKRVVFASSSSVYGDTDVLPLREDMEPDPMSPYARHKYMGEQYCKDFGREPFNLQTVCLRFFNVYGPHADPNGAYALVVAKFLEQKRQGEPLTITGDGTQTRDFTHVSDVVRAVIAAARDEREWRGDVVNIGGGRQISVNEVARLIGGKTVNVPARLEPHDTLASIKKAKEYLGWEPKVPFEEGIKQLLESNHL